MFPSESHAIWLRTVPHTWSPPSAKQLVLTHIPCEGFAFLKATEEAEGSISSGSSHKTCSLLECLFLSLPPRSSASSLPPAVFQALDANEKPIHSAFPRGGCCFHSPNLCASCPREVVETCPFLSARPDFFLLFLCLDVGGPLAAPAGKCESLIFNLRYVKLQSEFLVALGHVPTLSQSKGLWEMRSGSYACRAQLHVLLMGSWRAGSKRKGMH